MEFSFSNEMTGKLKCKFLNNYFDLKAKGLRLPIFLFNFNKRRVLRIDFYPNRDKKEKRTPAILRFRDARRKISCQNNEEKSHPVTSLQHPWCY